LCFIVAHVLVKGEAQGGFFSVDKNLNQKREAKPPSLSWWCQWFSGLSSLCRGVARAEIFVLFAQFFLRVMPCSTA